jgi:putative holliday junction resolvase
MQLWRTNQPALIYRTGCDRIYPVNVIGDSHDTPGRMLGLDLGTKTIGLAVSDPSRMIAASCGVIRRQGKKQDLARLAQVIREQEAVELVIGLPIHLDGRESEGCRRSRAFAAALESEFKLPVHFIDESLTTAEAEDILIRADLSRKKRKKVIDGLAAALILQSYLNELAEKRDRIT